MEENPPPLVVEEPQVVEVKKPSQAPLTILILVIGFIILGTLMFTFYTSLKKKTASTVNTPQSHNTYSYSNNYFTIHTINQQVLFPFISNFDNLTMNDLPSFSGGASDLREIFPYKDNLILHGIWGITEINPKTNTLVRFINKSTFDCLNYATKIDNYLYVACNGTAKVLKNSIYKIDLNTGYAVKEYTPLEKHDFENVTLASFGEDLFVGGTNVIYKINTKTDETVQYKPSDLANRSTFWHMFANEKQVWALGQTAGEFILIYNAPTGTWKIYDENVFHTMDPTDNTHDLITFAYSPDSIYVTNTSGIGDIGPNFIAKYNDKTEKWEKVVDTSKVKLTKPLDYRNKYFPEAMLAYTNFSSPNTFNYLDPQTKEVKDYTYTLEFSTIIDRVGDTYYLSSPSGIYLLKKNQFPTLVVKTDLSHVPIGDTTSQKGYITQDRNYALLVGYIIGPSAQKVMSDQITATSINLATGEVTDLMAKSGYSKKPYNGSLYDSLHDAFAKATVTQEGNTITYTANNSVIATIDLKKQTINLTPPTVTKTE